MAGGLGCFAVSLWQRLLAATPRPDHAPASRALFDGKTLQGWHAVPRLYVPRDARFATISSEKLQAAVVPWYEEHKQQDKLAHVGALGGDR